MYEHDKREIIEAALEFKRVGLIQLTGGNFSVRKESGDMIVTPSGMPYETMTEDQILVLNTNGELIEGVLRPSVDTVAIKYIFDHRPDVNAIIHTHQPYATAVGLIADELPSCSTTLCNVCLGAVKVAPYSSAASEDMGVQTVAYLGGKRAVILKHHGVIAVGPTLSDAVYSAIYLEDVAKSYLAAKAAVNGGEIALLTAEQTAESVNVHRPTARSTIELRSAVPGAEGGQGKAAGSASGYL